MSDDRVIKIVVT